MKGALDSVMKNQAWGNAVWMRCEPQTWCAHVWPSRWKMGKASACCVPGASPPTWCSWSHRWCRMILGQGHFYPLNVEDLGEAAGLIDLTGGGLGLVNVPTGLQSQPVSAKWKTIAEHRTSRAKGWGDQQAGNDFSRPEKETFRRTGWRESWSPLWVTFGHYSPCGSLL